ncbi:NADP-dependent oxidoreductase domain-containing protein, partial [Cercophora newfieldiana]
AIPLLIYGTARRHGKTPPEVHMALQAGYRAIDTAGSRRFHLEPQDGEAIQSFLTHGDGDNTNHGPASVPASVQRDRIFVQSKFAAPPGDKAPLPYNIGDDIKTCVLKSILRSADDLGTDTIDAYFLHTPLGSTGATVEAWRALEQLVDHGAVRYLGISNVTLRRLSPLYKEARLKPTFVQNWFRKGTAYDHDVMAFCREYGIVYQIFGVFDEENAGLLQCTPVEKQSRATSVSPHQALIHLLLAAAAARGLKLCILDGTTSPVHMRQNL